MVNFSDAALFFSGFDIINAKKEIKKIQSFNIAEFKEWQNNAKLSIVNHHYSNNQFYRNLFHFDKHSRWEEIPVLKKDFFQKPIEKNIANGVVNPYISNTSGSSGTPMYFAKDKFSHALTWAVIKSRYSDLGINDNYWQARFYGIPLDTIPYYTERVKDWLFRRYRFVIFDLSDEILDIFLKKFSVKKFDYIYGYTNSILIFAKYLLNKNIVLKRDICPSLKCCIVTSEQCFPFDKEIIEKAFGVDVINEYGVSESDFIAINDSSGNWKISNELVYLEVVDENMNLVPDGTVGNILVTSLHNKAMPFIRYQVGDRGAILRNNNGKYDELLLLEGRLNDLALLPSGKRVPGFTLYYVSRKILEESGILKEYVIKQTALNHFLLEVVSYEPISENISMQIKNAMFQYLEKGIEITIRRVEKIEKSPSGKHKHFHSLTTAL